jgi:prophage tail gpP-like protein
MSTLDGLTKGLETPIFLEATKAVGSAGGRTATIKNFSSYSFERTILTPASAFRMTAPDIDQAARRAIRSGDTVQLLLTNPAGQRVPVATGILDETDTHVSPANVEYLLSGRDFLGQLVDNSVIDSANAIQNTQQVSLETIWKIVSKGTRVPAGYTPQQVPNGTFIFQTNPGETRINALQRYLEFANCLVWTKPNGQVVLGKPNFTQGTRGRFVLSSSNPTDSNVLEGRVRRNVNQAIRQVVTQLQSMDQVSAGTFTKYNADQDVAKVRSASSADRSTGTSPTATAGTP